MRTSAGAERFRASAHSFHDAGRWRLRFVSSRVDGPRPRRAQEARPSRTRPSKMARESPEGMLIGMARAWVLQVWGKPL
eukprot:3734528-Pyramimonas_sp.AAC.1